MLARCLLPLAVVAALAAPPSALAQCTDWLTGPLQNSQAGNGADGNVNALHVWDPDGDGPQAARLVAGGTFSTIGGVTTGTIAWLDPSNGTWQRFASYSPFADVRALTTYNGQLVAGAGTTWDFTHTIVGRWTGSSWQSLGNDYCMSEFDNMSPDWVRALTVHNGQLVSGGNLTRWGAPDPQGDCLGGQWGYGLGHWDGVAHWRFDGQLLQSDVRALVVWNGELVAGGEFSGHGYGTRVGHWNGVTWTGFGTGTNDAVHALQPWNGGLVAGGRFTAAGGVGASRVAFWNGSAWQAMGLGMNADVNCLAVFNGQVVAGGTFVTASGGTANYIARWDGAQWQPLGTGLNGPVEALAVHNGELVAGGQFTTAGGQPANHIARWDGAQWSSFGGGTATGVYAFGTIGSRLVAGGDFHQSTRTAQPAHDVITWDGAGLSALGTGMNAPVYAFKTFKYSGINGSTELIAGGAFTTAGGVAANYIARWNEKPLSAIPPPAWAAMGPGFNGLVYAVERFNSNTYAGGSFTASGATGVSRIARWNETTDLWEAMSSGLNGPVYALKVYGGYLYVGGGFTTAGGVTANGLAKWDGAAWSAVSASLSGTVFALEVHNNELVIGGSFSAVSGSPNLARWNGTTLFGVSGGVNGTVRSLRTTGAHLYAGGDFTTAGGLAAPRLAWWDGTWHAAGGGADQTVRAIAAYNGEVHAGGSFGFVKSGTLVAPGWARWLETGAPWIAYNPSSRTVDSRGDVSFTAEPAAGYAGASLRWLKNGVPVADGGTISGSTVSGATTKTLTLSRIQSYDAGAYALVASNACGADTSFAATLSINQVTAAPPTGAPGASVFEAIAPNPARGATRLAFTLARAARVELSVHDVAGRRLVALDLGTRPAGSHRVAWDGGDAHGARLPAGVYLVDLRADGVRLGVRRVAMLR